MLRKPTHSPGTTADLLIWKSHNVGKNILITITRHSNCFGCATSANTALVDCGFLQMSPVLSYQILCVYSQLQYLISDISASSKAGIHHLEAVKEILEMLTDDDHALVCRKVFRPLRSLYSVAV